MKSGDKYGFYEFFSVSILVKSTKNKRKHFKCFKILNSKLINIFREVEGNIEINRLTDHTCGRLGAHDDSFQRLGVNIA